MTFFATVLGKENMSDKWWNWCNLSAKDWSIHGHRCGELWTLEMIENVQQNVELSNMPESPQNLKGVTNRPLIHTGIKLHSSHFAHHYRHGKLSC